MPKILIFSQDDSLLKSLSNCLNTHSYETLVFSDSEKAINSIREEAYDLAFIDFPTNNVTNHKLIQTIHCFQNLLPIIAIVDNNKLNIAKEAIQNGAINYIIKPLNPEALLLTLESVLKQANTLLENMLFRCTFHTSHDCNIILSTSDQMLKIYSQVEKIARTDLAVMLTGEAGIGKTTIAQRIHNKSQHNRYKFHKIDCANIPAAMQESELFGYVRTLPLEKTQNIPGVFEKNAGGTVFLDNIDMLPMNTQIKLLYLLHKKEIQLIGGSKMININIRLIVGSIHDLAEKTARGDFCTDLYNKLKLASITLPPLRERRKDIPEIINFFLAYFANQNSKNIEIESQALTTLCEYDWPGNIAQLKTLIERLVATNETGQIFSEELPKKLLKQNPHELKWNKTTDIQLDDIISLKKYIQTQEHLYIEKVLEHSGGDKALAAKKLGISLASFYRKFQESML